MFVNDGDGGRYYSYDDDKLIQEKDTTATVKATYKHNWSLFEDLGSLVEFFTSAVGQFMYGAFDHWGSLVQAIQGANQNSYLRDIFLNVLSSNTAALGQLRILGWSGPRRGHLLHLNTQAKDTSVADGGRIFTPANGLWLGDALLDDASPPIRGAYSEPMLFADSAACGEHKRDNLVLYSPRGPFFGPRPKSDPQWTWDPERGG